MYRNVLDDAEDLDCLVSNKNICIQGKLRITLSAIHALVFSPRCFSFQVSAARLRGRYQNVMSCLNSLRSPNALHPVLRHSVWGHAGAFRESRMTTHTRKSPRKNKNTRCGVSVAKKNRATREGSSAPKAVV